METAAQPKHRHRKSKIVVLCMLLAAFAAFLAALVLGAHDRPVDASSISHGASKMMVAVDECLDPREAKRLSDSGEGTFDLAVAMALLSEVRNHDVAEESTTYYESPESALAAARETHGESPMYRNLSKPIFTLEGPSYGGNLTAVTVCLTENDSGEIWLAFVFLDRRDGRYSNPITLTCLPADRDKVAQRSGSLRLTFASEEEKVAETFFDYLASDLNLFIANGKKSAYAGCSTSPAALRLTVLGRSPDEVTAFEYNGTVYYLWMYRTFDFNRFLIDSGFDFDKFYLTDLVRTLEISMPE